MPFVACRERAEDYHGMNPEVEARCAPAIRWFCHPPTDPDVIPPLARRGAEAQYDTTAPSVSTWPPAGGALALCVAARAMNCARLDTPYALRIAFTHWRTVCGLIPSRAAISLSVAPVRSTSRSSPSLSRPEAT